MTINEKVWLTLVILGVGPYLIAAGDDWWFRLVASAWGVALMGLFISFVWGI